MGSLGRGGLECCKCNLSFFEMRKVINSKEMLKKGSVFWKRN